MRIRIIITLVMFGITPYLAFSQEIPDQIPMDMLSKYTSDQQEKIKKAEQELLNAYTKGNEFIEAHGYPLDPNAENYPALFEEYQAILNDTAQKQQAFYESIPEYKNPNEPTSETITVEPKQIVPEKTSQIETTPVQKISTPKTIPSTREETNADVFPTLETTTPVKEESTQESSTKEIQSAETSPELTKTEIPTEPSVAKTMADMPEPVKEEPIIIPEEPEKKEAPVGIDTVSLENPQGNWLFKRIWWERAEERYEKIRLLVDAIWESRTIFFVKRNELDRNVLDPFYLNVGIGQGELQTILSELLEFFEKHREEHGDLTEQERMLYETIETEEESLKQLKLDIEAIANLDHAIDDALGTLMNQINRVRQFERQAWDNFKEIAHILNDTKARELYYMIEGAARNIKNISIYLEQDFFNHFTKLINEATKHVTRVQNQIEALKEKGINFKRQTEQIEQKQEQYEQEQEEEEVAPKPKLGWGGWILSLFKNAFNAVFSIIRIPYDMIFGK